MPDTIPILDPHTTSMGEDIISILWMKIINQKSRGVFHKVGVVRADSQLCSFSIILLTSYMHGSSERSMEETVGIVGEDPTELCWLWYGSGFCSKLTRE